MSYLIRHLRSVFLFIRHFCDGYFPLPVEVTDEVTRAMTVFVGDFPLPGADTQADTVGGGVCLSVCSGDFPTYWKFP